MAVVTRNHVTTITPTPWKWYAGAAGLLVVSAWADALSIVQVAFAAGVAGMGTGMIYRVVLDPEGFGYTFGTVKKRFFWAKVADFKVNAMRYAIFAVMQQVAFTELDKPGSITGKLAKFVSGGTATMPVYGIHVSRLIHLMNDYQVRRFPADTPVEAALSVIETVLPKPVSSPQAGRTVTKPVKPSKPVFSRTQPALGATGQKGRLAAGQDPLIQDSASRRRATRNSPLG